MLADFHKTNAHHLEPQIKKIQNAAIQNENIFEYLMEASKYCSLGQITASLFEVGGQYRRNM
jgi:methylmalonyl-CoA mutase